MALRALCAYDSDSSDPGGKSESSHDKKFFTTSPSLSAKLQLESNPNYFDGGESSSDNTEDDDAEKTCVYKNQHSASPSFRLPPPVFLMNSANSPSSSASVFKNSFRDVEQAEFDVLERHVKMTEQAGCSDAQDKGRRGGHKTKSVCAMFKKGRCRFSADRCRFSHTVGEHLMARLCSTQASDKMPAENATALAVFSGSAIRYNEREEIVDGEDSTKKVKKKPGISNNLQPPKKAMKLFDDVRKVEAPWLFDR